MNDVEALKSIDVFSGLTDPELKELVEALFPVRVNKGSYLFFRKDPSVGIFFVVQGSFQIIIDNDANKEITVYTIKQGGILGELSLFTNHVRSATAVSLEDSRLFKTSNERFIELMQKFPTIGVNLCKSLVERLLAANEMIERLGAMDGTERVVSYIRALVEREGRPDGENVVVDHRPTYYEISQRLGVSEKTIYRTVKSVEKTGAITVKGRKLSMKRDFLEKEEL